MHPRDCLFVYTDSMPEAQKADNEVFGEKRMTEALNQNPGAEPEELLNNIRNAVNSFVRDKPQYDDLTMLSFKYYGMQKPGNETGENTFDGRTD